jgi:hypothetical protein
MRDIRQLAGDEIDFVSGGDHVDPVRRMGQSATMGAHPAEPDYVTRGIGTLELLIWFW